jgi:hypothetical protein
VCPRLEKTAAASNVFVSSSIDGSDYVPPEEEDRFHSLKRLLNKISTKLFFNFCFM